MASTIYEKSNADFSNACHELARLIIYPQLFQAHPENISYEEETLLGESERGKILDGEMGIDRILHCKVRGLNGDLKFTIQERFRKAQYASFRDMTITEWNHASNLPSELYKINAGIFLYGYANAAVNDFIEVVAVNTTDLLHAIATGKMGSMKLERNKKQQSFATFKFDDLSANALTMYRYTSEEGHKLYKYRDATGMPPDPQKAGLYLASNYGPAWVSTLIGSYIQSVSGKASA